MKYFLDEPLVDPFLQPPITGTKDEGPLIDKENPNLGKLWVSGEVYFSDISDYIERLPKPYHPTTARPLYEAYP